MLIYNDVTRTFENKQIRFFIENRETSDEELIVRIPEKYVDRFEGHRFPTMGVFSKALMESHCAEEAIEYRRPHLIDQHERCLDAWLSR